MSKFHPVGDRLTAQQLCKVAESEAGVLDARPVRDLATSTTLDAVEAIVQRILAGKDGMRGETKARLH